MTDRGQVCEKFRENNETIQQLSSQLQEMQDQMNSMNHSCDFQVVGSNYWGRLSHVSSQLVMIPSFRDRRLDGSLLRRLTHGINLHIQLTQILSSNSI